jgi:soluble lytic murein transglycosylase
MMNDVLIVLRSSFIVLIAACHTTPPPAPPEPSPVTVATPTPPPAPDKHALALQALAAFDAKNYTAAIPLLQQAADVYPEVAPFLRLRVVEAESALGQWADAAKMATQISQQTPASTAATIARLRLPAIYASLGDAAQTNAAFEATKTVPIDELSEQDFLDLAANLDKAGRADLASQLRMRLLTTYPQGRETEDVYDKLRAAIPSPLDALSFDESLAVARSLAQHDRYDQALDLFRHIQQRFPQSSTSAEYRTIRLKALFNSRHYTDFLNEAGHGKLDPPKLELLRARAAWRTGANDQFLAGLRQVEHDYPDSHEADEAKILRAKYYTSDETNYDIAVRNLQDAIDNNDLGNEGENLWSLGWTYVLAGTDDEALRVFDDYAKRFPDGDYLSNSLFWSGKILAKRGDTAGRDAKWKQLQDLYPYSYYSYRAREIAKQAESAPYVSSNVFPNVDVSTLNEPRIVTVTELASLNLMRDATREMKALAAAYPDNPAVAFRLADLYVQAGEPFNANAVLQRKFKPFIRHGGSGIPHRFWEILFPLSNWDTIKEEAAKRQLDPYLIAAIIRQESGFEPTVVSNAGAVGIMQIMPAEAATIAARAGLPPPSRQDLFDPKINITIGAAEFSQKLANESGNPILAIAAYNAGEEAVGRWLAHTPVDDVDLFVEAIPYAETRLYVKTVSRNRYEYRRIYESSTASPQPQP